MNQTSLIFFFITGILSVRRGGAKDLFSAKIKPKQIAKSLKRVVYIFMFSLSLICSNLFSQDKTVDSLKQLLINSKHDSVKCQSLNLLGELYYSTNPDTSLVIWKSSELIAAKYIQGNFSAANLNIMKLYANAMNNIGLAYEDMGNIEKSLQYNQNSLNIREQIGSKKEIAISLNNLGYIYKSQHQNQKAIECFNKSLSILNSLNDKKHASIAINNIGIILVEENKSREALKYFRESKKIREDLGDNKGLATVVNNIASLYQIHGDPECSKNSADCKVAGLKKALENFMHSLTIFEEIGEKRAATICKSNIGAVHLELGEHQLAFQYGLSALKTSKEMGFPLIIKPTSYLMYRLYKKAGKENLALENYELYIKMRDSINNESTRKASIKNQLKYEYEKHAAADSVAHAKESEVKNVQLEKQKVEIAAKKNQQYALFGGLGLVIIFAGFMFNRFKVTQKQKGVIEHQKEVVEEQKKIVEEKQKEVLDSIRYAKRIQMAHLPNETKIQKSLDKLKYVKP